MAVEESLQTLLNPLAAGGCHSMEAPLGVAVPYIVCSVIDGVPQITLDGWGGKENIRMQIDIYHRTYKEAKTLKASVDSAMAGASFTNSPGSWRPFPEPETKLKRITMDYSIWS